MRYLRGPPGLHRRRGADVREQRGRGAHRVLPPRPGHEALPAQVQEPDRRRQAVASALPRHPGLLLHRVAEDRQRRHEHAGHRRHRQELQPDGAERRGAGDAEDEADGVHHHRHAHRQGPPGGVRHRQGAGAGGTVQTARGPRSGARAGGGQDGGGAQGQEVKEGIAASTGRAGGAASGSEGSRRERCREDWRGRVGGGCHCDGGGGDCGLSFLSCFLFLLSSFCFGKQN